LLFAGGGLGVGLGIGLGLALWLELRDKAIRTEQDVTAALDLPMLVSVPWLTDGLALKDGNQNYRGQSKQPPEENKEKETVEV